MPLKALLILDEAAAPDVVRAALADAGCAATWVTSSCATANTLLARERITPDLVIIDLAVDPRSDAMFIRLVRKLRDVPILLVASDAMLATPYSTRVLDYLLRPVRQVELTARAQSALRLRAERKRRDLRERQLADKVRKLEVENRDLECLVCADSLTGIANRRHVLTLLDAEWRRAARDETPLSLVILDLDHFHAYNETYGHPGGDSCLKRVAEAVAGCLRRPSDFLGRYGGEEFVVVLANTDAAGALIVAERVCKTVEALAIPHAGSPMGIVTISAGFATIQASAESSPQTLVGIADDALLQAKSQGRNRVSGDAPADAAARPQFNPWWTRFPIVVIDPWLAERIPQFLADARADVHSINIARRARNFDQVRVLARKLRATARDHGFDQIRELGSILDHAARDDDREGLRKAIVDLERYVTYVQVVYRRAPEHSPVTTS
ncbi:MAG: diguanylate cyclase [Myxococcota bacterium]|nr:diguanylate cyclase [Myxococcota bacterium]